MKWNFQKYLVDVDGKVIAKFEPRENPTGKKVVAAVEKALERVPAEKRPAASVDKPKKPKTPKDS